jgi:hypothetical protein
MMEYFLYLIYGPWQNILSFTLILLGVIVTTLPYLTQPIHEFKFRTLFGLMLVLAGVVGIACTFIIGSQEITSEHYKILTQEAKYSPDAKQLLIRHVQEHQEISHMDFVVLQHKIHQHHKETLLETQGNNP